MAFLFNAAGDALALPPNLTKIELDAMDYDVKSNRAPYATPGNWWMEGDGELNPMSVTVTVRYLLNTRTLAEAQAGQTIAFARTAKQLLRGSTVQNLLGLQKSPYSWNGRALELVLTFAAADVPRMGTVETIW